MVKGFSELGEIKKGITETLKMMGVESLKNLKNIGVSIARKTVEYGMIATQWAAEKAMAIWRFATGQKENAAALAGISEQSASTGLLGKAKAKLTAFAKGGKGPTKKDGSLDKRFKANKAPKPVKADKAAAASAGKKEEGGLKSTAEGLKAMGDKKVRDGIKNVALFGPAGLLALLAAPFMFVVSKVGKKAGDGLIGLSEGLKAKGMGASKVNSCTTFNTISGCSRIIWMVGWKGSNGIIGRIERKRNGSR